MTSTPASCGWRLSLLVLGVTVTVTAGSAASAQSAGWIENDRSGRIDKAGFDRVLAVTANSLNLRPDPSTRLPAVGRVAQGELVFLREETFNTDERRRWIAVTTGKGDAGWIAREFTEPVAPALRTLEQALLLAAAGRPASEGQPVVAGMPAVDKVRAGFVYIGPVGDAGWTFAHDQGRRALDSLPFVEWTRYEASVPEDPALVAAAIDRLVAEGANLVFTTSYGYMDPTIEAAARHPAVAFMHCSGFKTAPNAGTYFGREYEARFLAGLLAGGMTESGIIGFAAAFPIPEVLRGINAFTLGARSVNPEAEVRVVWTSTWYSPGIERDAAERLLDFGADVLTMHQDSPAVLQAAEQRGKLALGYHSDMSAFAPNATLASAVWNWAPIYTKVATDLHEGTWAPEKLWWGLDEGVVKLANIKADLPDSLLQRVAAAEAELREGRMRVFDGPIRDADGVERVPAGSTLGDAELLTMDYLVLGVKGGLPGPGSPVGSTQ